MRAHPENLVCTFQTSKMEAKNWRAKSSGRLGYDTKGNVFVLVVPLLGYSIISLVQLKLSDILPGTVL